MKATYLCCCSRNARRRAAFNHKGGKKKKVKAPGLKKKVGGDVNQTFTHAWTFHISARGARGFGFTRSGYCCPGCFRLIQEPEPTTALILNLSHIIAAVPAVGA